MADCISVMESAMLAVSNNRVSVPPRQISPINTNNDLFGVMPGSSVELSTYGVKLFSLYPDNPAKGLPALQGLVTLFDHKSGTPIAIIDGAEITAIRTAAASGLATQYLARDDARTCGIIGTGVQAIAHIDAMLAVRPVEEILIWGRDFGKAAAMAAAQSERTGLTVRATKALAEVGACDLVCTVTNSPAPILKGQYVKPGTHVNLVGAHSSTTREADTDLIVKSAVYVDLLASVHNEGGDILIPIQEGALDKSKLVGEIGQLLRGDIAGRTDEAQITLYKSLGIVAQDLFAAEFVYTRAKAEDVGVCLTF